MGTSVLPLVMESLEEEPKMNLKVSGQEVPFQNDTGAMRSML